MNLTTSDIAVLILKKLCREISSEEADQLAGWRNSSPEAEHKYQELTDYYVLLKKHQAFQDATAKSDKFHLPEFSQDSSNKRRRIYIWTAAAASIILLIGIGVYLWNQNRPISHNVAVSVPKDIAAPAINKAMITLSDGSKVFLDSAINGQLAQVGNMRLVKLSNGQVAYQRTAEESPDKLQYNTLSNPRGSQVISMMLSDGSKVWLNAGSTITYPVAFVGNERKVILTGEGYFEVAKDPKKKFIVTAKETTTEVLGTHFNVRAYAGKPEVKITLVEGSIKAGSGNNKVIIKPGEQAIAGVGKLTVDHSSNIEQVVAWKNGYFDFDGMTVKLAMQQIEEWYDVKGGFASDFKDVTLVGTIRRSISLNGLLNGLSATGGFHYKMTDNRNILIMP